MNNQLRYGLEKFEMVDDKGLSIGLVKVDEISKLDQKNLSIEEIIAIEEAAKYKAHYIYFRKFNGRPSIAQVYIYDFTQNPLLQNEELLSLHQKLYSSGHVPMFFVFTSWDVRIFNCYDRPAKGMNLAYKPLVIINLAATVVESLEEKEKINAFNAKGFDNGTFWENNSFGSKFKFAQSAYEKLLQELKQGLKDIIEKKILPATIAKKMMVTSILIKYLEERRDELGNSVFPRAGQIRTIRKRGKTVQKRYVKNFFSEFSDGAETYADVLRAPNGALQLFDYLAEHFNGGIFQFSDKERTYLEGKAFPRFSQFLEGQVEGVQVVLWKLYSFNDLPVELISNIYEEFLDKRPGVVYTPPYLVSFLLNESLPLNNTETNFKILDPACGSGVFLVGAYRRLIYRWRIKNKWRQPDLPTLKKLLRDNIFGCDNDQEAINLSIFSLSLALCDELSPLEIWETLELDNLYNVNLFCKDFFDLLSDKSVPLASFDLVIGNPPFEAKLTPAAELVEKEEQKDRKETSRVDLNYEKDKLIKVPDNQIALLFLEQSLKFCKEGRLLCLIQPSGPLLYNNSSVNFRNVLFKKNTVPQIIDFTLLRSVLFGKATVATCAVFIKKELPIHYTGLTHIIVNRSRAAKEKIFFEIDSYDFHFVPTKLLYSDNQIWKSNLFTIGSRVHRLIQKLENCSKLSDYLSDKEDWSFGEGFSRGSIGDSQASYLTNSNSLISKNFTSSGYRLVKLGQRFFERPRKEQLFQAPLCVIKEVIESKNGKLPIAWFERKTTFDSRILGISAPIKDKSKLKDVYKFIKDNNRILSFYILTSSSQSLISYSTAIRADDIYNIPFENNLEFTNAEKIMVDDFFDHILEYVKNGEGAPMIKQNAKASDLKKFGEVFCEVLNAVYSNLKPYQHFETSSFICFPFYFNDKPNIEFDAGAKTEDDIQKLVIRKLPEVNLRLTRVIRLYDNNVIYLIKPKTLKYWIRSIALRDADETFIDLRKQGF